MVSPGQSWEKCRRVMIEAVASLNGEISGNRRQQQTVTGARWLISVPVTATKTSSFVIARLEAL